MIEVSREEFVKRCNYRANWFLGDDFDSMVKSGLVLLDREGWEKIKTLIENRPKKKSLTTGVSYSNVEVDKWFEELRKAVTDD